MKPPKVKSENCLYVIHYKGQMLGTFKWPDSNHSLQGWRPPKKVYFTLGHAKCGLGHLPKDIQEDCKIVVYKPITND